MAEEDVPKRFGTDALIDEIKAFCKSKGINTFVFMGDDPDSDKYFFCRSGAHLWAVGACRRYEKILIDDLEEPS